MRIKYYVIESDEAPFLRWSNDDGWTDSDNYSRFSAEERALFNLPIGGHWLLVSEWVTA